MLARYVSPVNQPLAMVVPPWHARITKLQEFLTCLSIDRAEVLPGVMVVQIRKVFFR
jgi:hypothetical protein